MKVVHPGKPKNLEGGIKTSIRHQRKMMDLREINYTEEFSDDADILHINVLTPGDYLLMRKARKNGLKVAVHAHEIGENFKESFRFSTKLSPLVKRYVNFFYRRADMVFCPSAYAKRQLEERGIETRKTVLSNGIEPERFEGVYEYNTGEELRGEGFRAINISIVFERKGLSDFVETAEIAEDIDFTWYGKKYNGLLLNSDVDTTINESSENVDFPGFIEDIKEGFRSGDVFFFPTKSETQGLSLIEAAYCGLPLVIRDIPVYEFLEDGENCLKAEDPEGFAEKIRLLKEKPELRNKLRENAREVAEQHELGKVSRKLEKVYNRLLETDV